MNVNPLRGKSDSWFPGWKGIQPCKLTPIFKDYIWGGQKLKTSFGKHTNLPIVAESWELSAHPAGPSVICGGEFDGATLADMVEAVPQIIGTRRVGDGLPILIKLIDAKHPLSVQVHPNDAYARRVEGEAGKTEMWVVLDHQPGAYLYYGLKKPISPKELKLRLYDGSLPEALNRVEVRCGDVFFIPAGTIHAIGAGIVVAEVQQSSNATYRLYDYGRTDTAGNPRPLHVEKALEVASLLPPPERPPGMRCLKTGPAFALERLVQCPEFTVERLQLQGVSIRVMRRESFLAVLCTQGAATLSTEDGSLELAKGDCCFVPAGDYPIAFGGQGQLLLAGI